MAEPHRKTAPPKGDVIVYFTTETWYRIALGVLLTAFLAVRLHFQGKAKGIERIARRHERRDTFLYKLVASTYVLAVFQVLTPWLDFAQVPVDDWLRSLGGGFACAGIGIFWWSHHALGTNWSGILELSKGHVLVTEGPYRFVRHPMYSAFFLIGVGMKLLSANWLIGVTNLSAVTWMYLARVSAEEAMMLDRFGDAYRDYMGKTGRLLPSW